jgi:dethiobiotin synthetase
MKSIIISGTDTEVGKTVLSAMLMASLPEYSYWKPIQSGTVDGTDSKTVQSLSGCSSERILSETYVFSQPLSPHLAARIDSKTIESAELHLPNVAPLIIEGAGGLMVPLANDLLFIDIFKSWNLPVLLACRSGLGTINHTLLSIEALRNREIPLLGCVLIGEPNPENEKAIEYYGKKKVLGRIPPITSFTAETLRGTFNQHLILLKSIL